MAALAPRPCKKVASLAGDFPRTTSTFLPRGSCRPSCHCLRRCRHPRDAAQGLSLGTGLLAPRSKEEDVCRVARAHVRCAHMYTHVHA